MSGSNCEEFVHSNLVETYGTHLTRISSKLFIYLSMIIPYGLQCNCDDLSLHHVFLLVEIRFLVFYKFNTDFFKLGDRGLTSHITFGLIIFFNSQIPFFNVYSLDLIGWTYIYKIKGKHVSVQAELNSFSEIRLNCV